MFINHNFSIQIIRSEFRWIVISTIGIFAFWRNLINPTNDVFNMNGGHSVIWLLTYYLTGAYIGKYRVNYSGLIKYIYCFMCVLIYLFSSYLYIIANNNIEFLGKSNFQKHMATALRKMLTFTFDSFVIISQSTTACLFFLQIKFNKYISQVICFLGPLSFGIYLIHFHPLIFNNTLKHIFDNAPENLSLNSTIILILLKSLKIFVFCIIIDYFRSIIFELLKIRKFCIFLEEHMKNLIC